MIARWKFLVRGALYCSAPVMAAQNYVGAHVDNPEIVHRFVQNLPSEDSLTWQAWWYLESNDFDAANACFYKLAQLNHPQGYRGLADSYLAGHGVPQNTELALVLYEKAAKLGLGVAQLNAAVIRAEQGHLNKAKVWFNCAMNNPDMASLKEQIVKLYQTRMDGIS